MQKVIPTNAASLGGNHLSVDIVATDLYAVGIGWVDISITWRARPAAW